MSEKNCSKSENTVSSSASAIEQSTPSPPISLNFCLVLKSPLFLKRLSGSKIFLPPLVASDVTNGLRISTDHFIKNVISSRVISLDSRLCQSQSSFLYIYAGSCTLPGETGGGTVCFFLPTGTASGQSCYFFHGCFGNPFPSYTSPISPVLCKHRLEWKGGKTKRMSGGSCHLCHLSPCVQTCNCFL